MQPDPVPSCETMEGGELNRTIGFGCLTLIGVAMLFFFASGMGPYFYACSLEDRTLSAKTRQEMEKIVSLSSSHEIAPKDSMWGSRYNLKPGERMVQYRILWHENCPLDVVYDDADRVQAVFTSYE